MTDFDDWVAAAAPRLHRTAYLLVGDWSLAQDLVQHACAQTWPRFSTLESPEAYARTILVRTASSWWRRRWRGELPTANVPDVREDPWEAIDRRRDVQQALAALPAKQRAVLVLRYFDDLTEADTAAALGCAVGTVKSTTARALAALRIAGLEEVGR